MRGSHDSKKPHEGRGARRKRHDWAASKPWPLAAIIPAEALRESLLTQQERPDPRGLKIRRAMILGDLDLEYSSVPCPLHLLDCEVYGNLKLGQSVVPEVSLEGSRVWDVGFDLCRIQGSLIADRLNCAGEFRAFGATVGGQVHLDHATFSKSAGDSICLGGISVNSDIHAFRLQSAGAVDLAGSRVEGQLVLEKARIQSRDSCALRLDHSRIDGGIFARDLRVEGEVNAVRMESKGKLDLGNSRIQNPGKHALRLDGADIRGGIAASEAVFEGQFCFPSADIGVEIDFTKATLDATGSRALSGQLSRIKHLCLRVAHSSGEINLTGAAIDNLEVGSKPPTPIVATGWSLRDLTGPPRSDWKASRDWLDSQKIFTSQPWHEIAGIYERNGQASDARRMRHAAAWRLTRKASWPNRWIRTAYGLLVGHGYYPLFAVIWLAAVLAVAGTATHDRSQFVPVSASARSAQPPPTASCPSGPEPLTADANPGCLTPGYPVYQPLLYALTVTTPASAVASPAWIPRSAPATWVLAICKVAGWLLTAMLLAALAGLLKRG